MPLTPLQVAVRDASEQLRTAWTMGLNLHTLYDTLYKNQTQWNTPQSGGSFHQGLPYWSKVEKLTIHHKTVLDPTAADPARRPISQIDMALSEGVTRKFVECMVTIDGVPNDAAGANAFLAAHATAAEITAAHATPAAHRDLWIKAILRVVGPITGPEARDLRVVHELVRLSTMWGTVLQHRELDPQVVEAIAPSGWFVLGSGNGLRVWVTGRPAGAQKGDDVKATLKPADQPLPLNVWNQAF